MGSGMFRAGNIEDNTHSLVQISVLTCIDSDVEVK